MPSPSRVSRLSYSAIALHERCGYRYYAERIVGMQPVPWDWVALDGEIGPHRTEIGLHPTEIGDAVHRVLELVDLSAPTAPEPADLGALVRAWYPKVAGDELSRIGGLVRGYTSSRSQPGSPRFPASGRSGRSHSSWRACS